MIRSIHLAQGILASPWFTGSVIWVEERGAGFDHRFPSNMGYCLGKLGTLPFQITDGSLWLKTPFKRIPWTWKTSCRERRLLACSCVSWVRFLCFIFELKKVFINVSPQMQSGSPLYPQLFVRTRPLAARNFRQLSEESLVPFPGLI